MERFNETGQLSRFQGGRWEALGLGCVRLTDGHSCRMFLFDPSDHTLTPVETRVDALPPLWQLRPAGSGGQTLVWTAKVDGIIEDFAVCFATPQVASKFRNALECQLVKSSPKAEKTGTGSVANTDDEQGREAVAHQVDGHPEVMLRSAVGGDIVARLSRGTVVRILEEKADSVFVRSEATGRGIKRGWAKSCNFRKKAAVTSNTQQTVQVQKPKEEKAPQEIIVTSSVRSPSGPDANGTYHLVNGTSAHGLPVWKRKSMRTSESLFLFTGKNGRWLIGTDLTEQRGVGWISTSCDRGARLPHEMQGWTRFDGFRYVAEMAMSVTVEQDPACWVGRVASSRVGTDEPAAVRLISKKTVVSFDLDVDSSALDVLKWSFNAGGASIKRISHGAASDLVAVVGIGDKLLSLNGIDASNKSKKQIAKTWDEVVATSKVVTLMFESI